MSKFRYLVDFGDPQVNKEEEPPESQVNYEEVLRGWHTLHLYYNELTLNDCINLLTLEAKNRQRPLLIERLKSRIRKLCSIQLTEVLDDFTNKTSASTKQKRNNNRTVSVPKD